MSVIRNLLYGNASVDTFNSDILYNQNLLINFIKQHQPKYILHCGSSDNAVNLAQSIRDQHKCEILHIQNWHLPAHHWLEARGNPPTSLQQLFQDKILELNLEDHLIAFDGAAQTAYEVLSQRNFHFSMMISDNLGHETDYIPLLGLLYKNALHIRYVGHKPLNSLKDELIFTQDIDTPFAYAQGFLITGMDYISLYEDHSQSHNERKHISDQELKEAFRSFETNLTHAKQYIQSATQDQDSLSQDQITEINNEKEARALERAKRREERRKRREAREQQTEHENLNKDPQETSTQTHSTTVHLLGSSAITRNTSAPSTNAHDRAVLRAQRLERRRQRLKGEG